MIGFVSLRPLRVIATISYLMLGMMIETLAVAETLNQAFDKAWAIYPEASVLEARVDEVAAKKRAVERWFFTAPSIGVAYKDDRLLDDIGKSSQEIFVTLSLWQPGLRDAERRTVYVSNALLRAERRFHRWQLAGELRRRYWNLAESSVRVKNAKQRYNTTEQLVNDVKKRLDAGDLSQADFLLSQGELLAARAQAADANRTHNIVGLAYQELTGEQMFVDAESEMLNIYIATSNATNHPALFKARLAVEFAQAQLEEVKADERDTPSLKIVYERERENSFEPNINSIGLEFELPLGTPNRNEPRITAALVQLNKAKAEQLRQHRRVDLAQVQARTVYQQAVDGLKMSQQRWKLMQQHYQLALKSFNAGQLSLVELLRFKQNTDEVAQETNLLRIKESWARSTLNQVMGFLP